MSSPFLLSEESKMHKRADKKQPQKGLYLDKILPLTHNQKLTFDAYAQGQNLLLHGSAGTGKSFISLYLALNEIMNTPKYDRILIIRSAVPTKDQGFLPGTLKEKSRIYEEPYIHICNELLDRGDAYEIMKNKGQIEFTTTSYLRGLTFDDTIIILDEQQNSTFQEISTVLTRVGENSRVILCGDFKQSDMTREVSGINKMIRVAAAMSSFTSIEFGLNDIVRSGFVKEFLIASENID